MSKRQISPPGGGKQKKRKVRAPIARSTYRKKTWKEQGRTETRTGRGGREKKKHSKRSAAYKKKRNQERRRAWKKKRLGVRKAIGKPANLKPGAKKKGCRDFDEWERRTLRDLKRKGNTFASLPGLLREEAEKEGREVRTRGYSACRKWALGAVKGTRRGAPPIPKSFKDALVYFSDKIRKRREDKGETPLRLPIAASGFPGSESSARRSMKQKGKSALPCRVKPPLTEVNREERRERCEEIVDTCSKEFFQDELIYVDCKSFDVCTTHRKKLLARRGARRFVWRTRTEGLLPECTKPSKFAAKGGGRCAKIFAAILQ